MASVEYIPEHPPEYREFFRLFNLRHFYEAHEVLEDLWVMEVPPLRNYYKGLIMAAVALCHWSRGNPGPARSLYRDARAYLVAYPRVVEGFQLGEFLDNLDRLFASILAGATAPYPANQIPTIQLLD